MSLKTVPTQQKYGLIKKTSVVQKPLPQRKVSLFKDDLEDDEDETISDVCRVNLQLKKNSEKTPKPNAATEDPSIYDYDGTYDTFKAAEVTSHPLSRAADPAQPKSRYVTSLLDTAKMREREKDRVYEKKLLKERLLEDDQFVDQPKFVTKAYKEKLIQDKKWEYENRLAEELEQKTDVRKSGMQGFYANLLTKNISMGGDVDANAVSVYTAGSARQAQVIRSDQQTQQEQQEQNHQKQQFREEKEGKRGGDEETGYLQALMSSSSGEDRSSVDQETTHLPSSPLHTEPVANHTNHDVLGGAEQTAARAEKVEPAAPVVDKVEQVLSAKERYLARKRKAEEDALH